MTDPFLFSSPDAPPAHNGGSAKPRVYPVSELTHRIKHLLEGEIGTVWVEGEISNLRRPASGHAYFTLKDAKSQIRAVMFRSALQQVKLPLRDGIKVRVHGGITVYETSGDYQISVRHIEAAGEGDLALRFEELKQKLEKEGLFDSARKRRLPFLPRHIGIVTSPTGAAIRDILQVLGRRYPNVHVLLAPVRVQGEGAAAEIAAAIDELNARGGLDVLIVGRGGGSLEDLWAFNEEAVVRAVVRSRIPVISAVGHEIDFTLCDFAADFRAPTPSAAAESVLPTKEELERRLQELRRRLQLAVSHGVDHWRRRVDQAARTSGLRDPMQWLAARQQRVDMQALRIQKILGGLPQRIRHRADTLLLRMQHALFHTVENRRHALQQLETHLNLLNPRAVLQRGYTLTRREDGSILRSSAELSPGAVLITEWHDGRTTSILQHTEPHTGDVAHDNHTPEEKHHSGSAVRKSRDPAGGNRDEHGQRPPRSGRDDSGLRGGAKPGQTLLFETE